MLQKIIHVCVSQSEILKAEAREKLAIIEMLPCQRREAALIEIIHEITQQILNHEIGVGRVQLIEDLFLTVEKNYYSEKKLKQSLIGELGKALSVLGPPEKRYLLYVISQKENAAILLRLIFSGIEHAPMPERPPQKGPSIVHLYMDRQRASKRKEYHDHFLKDPSHLIVDVFNHYLKTNVFLNCELGSYRIALGTLVGLNISPNQMCILVKSFFESLGKRSDRKRYEEVFPCIGVIYFRSNNFTPQMRTDFLNECFGLIKQRDMREKLINKLNVLLNPQLSADLARLAPNL